VETPERAELRCAERALTPERAALDASTAVRRRRSVAARLQALTLGAVGTLIVAGFVTEVSALFYVAIGLAPSGDALASWLRRRERSRLGAG
jgi:hypothetical protein